MIKFFRKIRYDLMEKNKTGQYFKYAIGEIVLVVLGILIALQISDWNEARKAKVQELNILQNFKKSLADDAGYRAESIRTYDIARRSMDYLIDYMDSDLPYKDSLNYHFNTMVSDWGLVYDFSTYEELKSRGTNTITNETLRTAIIMYYSYAEGLGTASPQRYTKIIDDASKTILAKHFDQRWPSKWVNGVLDMGEVKTRDYEALKKDKEFRYFLKSLRNENYWLIDIATGNVEERNNNIAAELDKEIARLKN